MARADRAQPTQELTGLRVSAGASGRGRHRAHCCGPCSTAVHQPRHHTGAAGLDVVGDLGRCDVALGADTFTWRGAGRSLDRHHPARHPPLSGVTCPRRLLVAVEVRTRRAYPLGSLPLMQVAPAPTCPQPLGTVEACAQVVVLPGVRHADPTVPDRALRRLPSCPRVEAYLTTAVGEVDALPSGIYFRLQPEIMRVRFRALLSGGIGASGGIGW